MTNHEAPPARRISDGPPRPPQTRENGMPSRLAAAETADSEEDEQQPKGVPTPSTGPSFFESAGTETSLTFYDGGALHEQVLGESDDDDAMSTSTLSRGKKVRRTRKKNHRRVVVSVVSCKYDVVAQAARGLGWRCTTDEHEEFNLLWNDSYVPFDTIAQLNKYQKVNHFPGMSELAKKNLLAKNLNRIAKQMPGEFSFVPPTFILPGESESLKSWFQSQARAAVFCPPAAVVACACGRGHAAYLEPHPTLKSLRSGLTHAVPFAKTCAEAKAHSNRQAGCGMSGEGYLPHEAT